MNIRHKSADTRGKFYMLKEGEEVAFLTYTIAEAKRMIIRYTEVTPALRGRNLARKLVKEAAAYARNHNLKIVPLCYYVKLVMERDDNLRNLLSH